MLLEEAPMESLTIRRLDAAKRQLETAMSLYFGHGDPISIHALACAAYDIIDGVNQHRGGKEMWVKRRYTQSPGRPTRGDLNEVQNFLKHADRDPEGTLDFFPLLTEPMLADASRTYVELTGDLSPVLEVMLRWFHCRGGKDHFDWPDDRHALRDELLALFASGDRGGFVARCARP
jgi:hypothetical protein